MPNLATSVDHALKTLTSKSIKQGRDVRATVRNLTLQSLQQRELSLEQIRKVLRSIVEGVGLGVGKRELKAEKVLADAVAGMDDALLKVVQASNLALHRLTGDGYDFEDSNLKQALDGLERLEDEFLQSISAVVDSAGEKMRAPWERVLRKTKMAGTATGAQVKSSLRDYAKRTQAAMRAQRETGFKAAYLVTQNFSVLARGILIGMSEGLEGKSPRAKSKKSATTGRRNSPKRGSGNSTKRASAKRAPSRTAKRSGSAKHARKTRKPRTGRANAF